MILISFFVFSLLSVIFCAPRTKENSDYNTNFNTNHDPKSYYGKYDGHNYHPSPSDWRKESIYQFITDRFSDGNPRNNEGKYGGYDLYKIDTRHGGDVTGIKNRLDYIKALGFTAIWISPIFQNMENSYHGYGQIDFTLLDDRFGTVSEFRDMINAAHKKGIYVIVDIVVNHMSNLYYFEGYKDRQAPFKMHTGEYKLIQRNENTSYVDFNVVNNFNPSGKYHEIYGQDGYAHYDNAGEGSYWDSDFHHNGDLVDYSDPFCNCFGKIYGVLDDLRTTHSRVADKLIAMGKSLISTLDIDGIRMDTPMQVDLNFHKRYVSELKAHASSLGKNNFYMFAEFYCSKEFAADMTGRGKTPDMYGKDDSFISNEFSYNGGIYYPFYNWILSAIKDQKGNINGLLTSYYDDWTKFDFYNNYVNDNRYLHAIFFNNHDQWRMAAAEDGFRKQDLSTFIVLTFPGVPLYYYGDEQGLLTLGTALDGFSREDMMTSLAWNNYTVYGQQNKAIKDNFDMVNDHYLLTKKINLLRRIYNIGYCDSVIERYTQPNAGNGLLFYTRQCPGYGDENHVLIAWNSWKFGLSSTSSFKAFDTGNEVIVNVLNPSEEIQLDGNGYFPSKVSLDGYEFKFYVKKKSIKQLPPYIVKMNPSHDTQIVVSRRRGIEFSKSLRFSFAFSDVMDIATVKKAISVSKKMRFKNVACSSTPTQCDVDVEVIEEGIHFLYVNEDTAVSKDGRMNMDGNFQTRIRVGSNNNILINPNAVVDHSMIDVLSRNQIQIRHKAIGAELYRVYFGYEKKWTNWMNFDYVTKHNVDTTKNQEVKIQYYVDNSAAYYVKSRLTIN